MSYTPWYTLTIAASSSKVNLFSSLDSTLHSTYSSVGLPVHLVGSKYQASLCVVRCLFQLQKPESQSAPCNRGRWNRASWNDWRRWSRKGAKQATVLHQAASCPAINKEKAMQFALSRAALPRRSSRRILFCGEQAGCLQQQRRARLRNRDALDHGQLFKPYARRHFRRSFCFSSRCSGVLDYTCSAPVAKLIAVCGRRKTCDTELQCVTSPILAAQPRPSQRHSD